MVDNLLKELATLKEATTYTQAVGNTLNGIKRFCLKQSNRDNHWIVGNKTFFFEFPEFGETDDGSVEGPVYERIGRSSRFVGEYHIDGDGRILDFPFLPITDSGEDR